MTSWVTMIWVSVFTALWTLPPTIPLCRAPVAMGRATGSVREICPSDTAASTLFIAFGRSVSCRMHLYRRAGWSTSSVRASPSSSLSMRTISLI